MLSTELLPQINFENYSGIRQHYIDQHDSLSSEEDFTFYERPEGLIPSYILKMTFLSVVEELARKHGLDYVYNEITESNKNGQEWFETSSSVDESTVSQAVSRGMQPNSLHLSASPDFSSEEHPDAASYENKKYIYGPVVDMYKAERSLDFITEIVI